VCHTSQATTGLTDWSGNNKANFLKGGQDAPNFNPGANATNVELDLATGLKIYSLLASEGLYFPQARGPGTKELLVPFGKGSKALTTVPNAS
jgi:hypothetical protein